MKTALWIIAICEAIRAAQNLLQLWIRRRTGRWVWAKDENYAGGGKTTCTACGNSFADGAFFEVEDFNYCPTCGAYMQKKRGNRE